MIHIYKINFTEASGTLKLVEHVVNYRNDILILNCDVVQLKVVNTYFEEIIFLTHERIMSLHGETLDMMNPLF